MSRDPVRAASQFFGGRVCLDFANTLDWRLTVEPVELIPDYTALLSWSLRRGMLSERTARLLKRQPAPGDAQAAMKLAHTLRGQIWGIADALRAGTRADVREINSMLLEVPRQPGLIHIERRIAFDLDGTDARQPLWPVLWSLTTLLASEDAQRLGMCEAEGCGWYFVDESPNHSRRWCSSEVCGNRERARRAYRKKRSI